MLALDQSCEIDLELKIEYYLYQFERAVERKDPKAIKFHGNKVAIFVGLENDRLEEQDIAVELQYLLDQNS
tara:strand:+ start:319 stop:531 length:213 start_codon:yes stop_codon:yes gene_type:complete